MADSVPVHGIGSLVLEQRKSCGCYWGITDGSDVNDQNKWLVYQWADAINQARGIGWGGQEEDVILHLSGDEARKCVDRVGRNSVNEPEDTNGN